jgi:hypothetical protein
VIENAGEKTICVSINSHSTSISLKNFKNSGLDFFGKMTFTSQSFLASFIIAKK